MKRGGEDVLLISSPPRFCSRMPGVAINEPFIGVCFRWNTFYG